MITVQNLSKHYHIKMKKDTKKETKIAVNNLSFTALPGQITGLIGENGAGKTTTMRILTTLISQTSGDASINNIDVSKEPEQIREQIGVLFGGDPVLYDNLSAKENIMYFAQLNGMSKEAAEQSIERLADALDMNDYLHQKAKGFSRGMKQKVAIARTIAHDPNVIIFDEPTTGLDITTSRIIYDFLEAYKAEGKTILLSSHSMYEVERLCDTIIVLHKGAKQAEGTLQELLTTYNEERFEDVFIHLTGGATHV